MKRTSAAIAALVLSITLTSGIADATSSPGGAGGKGGSGSSGSSGSSNGSAGAPGSSNSNCLGAVSILIYWFGIPGTITQCK